MIEILTRIEKEYARFRPRNGLEVFALHVARALDDADSVRGYAQLIAHHGLPEVIAAYRKFRHAPELRSESSYHALRKLLSDGIVAHSIQLAHPMVGVAIERRTVGAAIFENGSLAYTLRRELAADGAKALRSVDGFARVLLERQPGCTVALEVRDQAAVSRRYELDNAVRAMIRDHGVPIWHVSTLELHSGYGHPPCATRKELRDVVESIWPFFRPRFQNTVLRDAVAIGFHAYATRVLASSDSEDREEVRDTAA